VPPSQEAAVSDALIPASDSIVVRRSWADSVSVPPSRLDRVFTSTDEAAEVSSRLTPLNTALSMKLAACDSSWSKSSARIWRCAVVMPSFESSVSFARTLCSRFETPVAPAIATLPIPLALFRPCVTAPIAFSSPRMPWAMEKFEASSSAPATFRPVDTRFWVTSRLRLTEFRVRSATKTDGLVLMEFWTAILASSF
jgi:hypothetical protein